MERYESLGLVGEGSYGTVLKCRHRDSGRLVAIKKFMDSDDDKTVKKIALREIKLLRQLRHDNLVNLLEVWKRRRRWYLVFEFVERTLLDDLEQNPNGLDLNTSRQYLYQILRATAFCHQQNVIHRDIKPENVLISHGGVVKLCDFGFARTVASPAEGGVYTDYVATRWYRAPELLVGDTKYGKPVDVWALGCLLMEMLTGQPLFPGDSDLDQIHHIVRFFGNLAAHHQTLFYRNPVFSGVKLPESFSKVPLEHRYPAISPMVLELAQGCLQMDPERRTECSKLLEYPLFVHDSFHIRFVEELNAKIQKEHRENSTLPKITKTPTQGVDEEDKRTWKGEKMKIDEKMDKAKGKQSKVSMATRDSSEPSVKPPKGSKATDSTAKISLKNKPTKCADKPKIIQTPLQEGSSLQDNAGSKTEKSPDHRDGKIKPKDAPRFPMSRENTAESKPGGSKYSESSQTSQPSYHTNVPTILNKSAFSSQEHEADVSTPSMLSPTAEPVEVRPSEGTVTQTLSLISFTKQSKNTSQSQTNQKTSNQKLTGDSPKPFSSKPVFKNAASNSMAGAQVSGKMGSTLSKPLAGRPPLQFSKVCVEILKKGNQRFESTSDAKNATKKNSKALGELTEPAVALRNAQHGHHSSKDKNPENEPQDDKLVPQCLSRKDYWQDSEPSESVESHDQDDPMTKASPDHRVLRFEETPVANTLIMSDRETLFLASQTTVQGTNRSLKIDYAKSVIGHLKVPGTLKNHTRSPLVLLPSCNETDKQDKQMEFRNTSDPMSITAGTSIMSSNMDNVDLGEADVQKRSAPSPPPPPPPPSSTPLLIPPSAIMPYLFSVTGQNQPACHHRHVDFRHQSWTFTNRYQGSIYSRHSLSSHLTGSNPAQLMERSVTCERFFPSDLCSLNVSEPRRKLDVQFPDVKSPVLPDVQGRDSKQSKCVRKEKDHTRSELPPEPGPDEK
ncbi:cyclin-dependent kinase-like 5 isoform X1 [Synchiropus splendidus]|uniref:cyclin-dependent kinase-like 5 isoform X1 n=1 Tax=Synchiropus splendidus TaxID=270530 RepID=UPI00237DA02E|nr:cyclin-dependent kinase-like 5 isoform X1 [Synchiropus splendidus]